MSGYGCEFCGEDLSFRMIGGAIVPRHPMGRSCRGRKCYRSENIDRCVFTRCPKCEGEEFFVRHNGGSVWFDSPGKPWPKHGCFDNSDHPLPRPRAEADGSGDGMVVQAWLYSLLRGEDGGAFLVSEYIRESKPHLKGLRLGRLLCPPGMGEQLKELDGKLVIRSRESVATMGGLILKRDGWYQSSLRWWESAQG